MILKIFLILDGKKHPEKNIPISFSPTKIPPNRKYPNINNMLQKPSNLGLVWIDFRKLANTLPLNTVSRKFQKVSETPEVNFSKDSEIYQNITGRIKISEITFAEDRF